MSHPGLVRRMKQSPDKHDRGDAHVLADLQRLGYLPRVWLAPAAVRELRRLVRFRQQLADRRRDVKLRIGALLRDLRLTCGHAAARWTKPWLAWVASVTVDGSTRFILDEHLLELRQLGERIGLAERRLAGRTKDGPVVRRLLEQPGIGPVTAAHRLARHEPRWRELYRQLRGRGKPACVALAAVANRWMRTLYHQMKDLEQPAGAERAAH
jgi:hypothetical protein